MSNSPFRGSSPPASASQSRNGDVVRFVENACNLRAFCVLQVSLDTGFPEAALRGHILRLISEMFQVFGRRAPETGSILTARRRQQSFSTSFETDDMDSRRSRPCASASSAPVKITSSCSTLR